MTCDPPDPPRSNPIFPSRRPTLHIDDDEYVVTIDDLSFEWVGDTLYAKSKWFVEIVNKCDHCRRADMGHVSYTLEETIEKGFLIPLCRPNEEQCGDTDRDRCERGSGHQGLHYAKGRVWV